MSRSAPRVGVAIAIVVLLATIAWRARRTPGAPPAVASAPSAPAEDARAPEAARQVIAPSATATEAPADVAARPRLDAPVDVDPCAREDDDGARLVRPSIADVIDARVGELVARSRALGPGASDALREGLAALAGGGSPEAAISRVESAPDRRADGFDHAAAAAVYAGVRALREGRFVDAGRLGARASRLAPSDPAGALLEALASLERQERAVAREALGRAYAIDGEEPAIAWALGAQLARSERPGDALPVLDAYLAALPGDAGARRLRARAAIHATAVQGATRRQRGGVVLLAPRALEADVAARVLATIDEALTGAARWTGTERTGELVVIVHADREAMRAATCTPSWTGAVFDGALHTDLDTMRGAPEAARSMLRHETLHAQLHLSPGGTRRALPYWLDEGMAQRFAGEEDAATRRSWALMVRARTWIPFPSIEGAFVEIDDPHDARLAYHQSLAMVRYLEERHGARAIAGAVEAADRGVAPDAMLHAIAPELDGAGLLAMLERELAGAVAD